MNNQQSPLGDDGELNQSAIDQLNMFNTGGKRKRRDSRNSPSIAVLLVIVLVMLLGLIGGLYFGRSGVSIASTQPIVYVVTATNKPAELLPTQVKAIMVASPTVALAATYPRPATIATLPDTDLIAPASGFPVVPPGQFGLVIATISGKILTSVDGATFHALAANGQPVIGQDVAASPDGKMIAYVRKTETRIFVYRDGKEIPLNSFGMHKSPAWGPHGKYLTYLASGMDSQGHQGDGAYWLKMTASFASDAALYIDHATSIGAPSITDPISGQLLIVSNESLKSSSFSTIDPICGCQGNTPNYLLVDYYVTWASYQPDGKQLVFSEDGGNLYMLDTVTQKVTPFIVDSTAKNRPVFSPDGKKIAYFDDKRTIYVVTLADKSVTKVQIGEGVESLDWLSPSSG